MRNICDGARKGESEKSDHSARECVDELRTHVIRRRHFEHLKPHDFMKRSYDDSSILRAQMHYEGIFQKVSEVMKVG